MDSLRLIAVYDDLNAKIKAIMESIPEPMPGSDGINGKNGKDGKDAPDRTSEMFAAVAALHATLTEKLIQAQQESQVVFNHEPSPYKFRVHRDSRGYIETVDAVPTNNIL